MRIAGIFVTLTMLACCGKATETRVPLAKAYDQYLYPGDVKEILPQNLTAADSERVMHAFIDNWIRDKVLQQKAEANLTEQEKNVQPQIDEYRNALLLYKYQMKLVSERMDTTVTDEQLLSYYNANMNNFELKKNVVQLAFVKLDEASPLLSTIRKLFRSSRIADKTKLAALCSKQANNFFLDDEVWLDFDEILKELPITSYDQEHFLRNNKFLEIKEGNYIYLINIRAYRIRNSVAAFGFEKENIRNILLNQRKLQLLKEMELGVMKEAEMNNDVARYR